MRKIELLWDTYLYTLLFQVHLQGQLFAQHYVGVVRLLEGRLQLLQLFFRENGAMTAFPLGRRPVPHVATVRMMGMVVARMMVVVVAETSSRVGHCMCNGSRVHIIGVEVRVGHWKEEERETVRGFSNCKCTEMLVSVVGSES